MTFFHLDFLSAFFIFVCLLAFCAFTWLCFCAFSAFWCFLRLFMPCVLFVLFVREKSFRKKKIKKFKIVLITSFILLPNFLQNSPWNSKILWKMQISKISPAVSTMGHLRNHWIKPAVEKLNLCGKTAVDKSA